MIFSLELATNPQRRKPTRLRRASALVNGFPGRNGVRDSLILQGSYPPCLHFAAINSTTLIGLEKRGGSNLPPLSPAFL